MDVLAWLVSHQKMDAFGVYLQSCKGRPALQPPPSINTKEELEEHVAAIVDASRMPVARDHAPARASLKITTSTTITTTRELLLLTA